MNYLLIYFCIAALSYWPISAFTKKYRWDRRGREAAVLLAVMWPIPLIAVIYGFTLGLTERNK